MKTVTIQQTQYLQMLHDSVFLECLRSVGVDNWEGYDDACALFAQEDLDAYDSPTSN